MKYFIYRTVQYMKYFIYNFTELILPNNSVCFLLRGAPTTMINKIVREY